jgi:tetrapyrrole methylase family protein/MazG family protein/ATP diphosphatase
MTPNPGRGESLPRLVEIMQRLLAPDGCPWDRAQSLGSLKAYLIEEAYEVCEAIDRRDSAALCEELGDVLLQIVFQSEIARANGWFGPDDVVASISDKLVRRHPHVFGDSKASSPEEVHDNWEKLKAAERARKGGGGALDGVPQSLPGLLAAARITEKAAQVGFDWPEVDGPRHKVDEELAELDAAIATGDRAAIQAELGDVLFSLVNVARKLGVDPEDAIRSTTRRFRDRFGKVEQVALSQGRPLSTMTLAEMDAIWDEAKRRD